jgi:hypothetical protein
MPNSTTFMPEGNIKLGGNISLVGFEQLDSIDLETVTKIVVGYIKKMAEIDSQMELRLTLHLHPHGKSFKHEVEGFAISPKGRFAANVVDWNLFTAVSAACDKIINEVMHVNKKEQRHDKKTFK